MDILDYAFMQRALLAAVLVGITAPAVGVYLVQRRQALMGDGIGHVAVTGVAIGLMTHTSPTLTAVAIHTGEVESRKPRPTPVIATWPMPSPIRA